MCVCVHVCVCVCVRACVYKCASINKCVCECIICACVFEHDFIIVLSVIVQACLLDMSVY